MLPVAILDPRHAAGREAFIDELIAHERRVDVLLTLDDGRPARACVVPDDVVWLDLRRGDIVGVRLVSVLPECGASVVLVSV